MTSTSSSTPDTPFKAFINNADAAPSRFPVFPVTTLPSGSCIAPAGFPVVSAFNSAAERAGERLAVIPALLMSISILLSPQSSTPVLFCSTAAEKYLRTISLLDASRHASSSTIAYPAIFTPISVGLLYGLSPAIFSIIERNTGNISTSRL